MTTETRDLLVSRLASPANTLQDLKPRPGKVTTIINSTTIISGEQDEPEHTARQTTHLMVAKESGSQGLRMETLYQCLGELRAAALKCHTERLHISRSGIAEEEWLNFKKMLEWTFAATDIPVVIYRAKKESKDPGRNRITNLLAQADDDQFPRLPLPDEVWNGEVRATGSRQEEPPLTKPKERGDSMIVRTGNASYTDVIKQIKAGVDLGTTGVVQKITRTRTGDIKLMLDKGHNGAEPLLAAIKSVVGDERVSLQRNQVVMTIRDMDEATTNDELKVAVEAALGDLRRGIEIRQLRPAYRGTQVATIMATPVQARKLLSLGHVRVGWSSARIRIRVDEEVCFLCRQPGHIANQCGGTDRTGRCFNCGETGHLARNCSAVARCARCNQEGHRAGATACGYRVTGATEEAHPITHEPNARH